MGEEEIGIQEHISPTPADTEDATGSLLAFPGDVKSPLEYVSETSNLRRWRDAREKTIYIIDELIKRADVYDPLAIYAIGELNLTTSGVIRTREESLRNGITVHGIQDARVILGMAPIFMGKLSETGEKGVEIIMDLLDEKEKSIKREAFENSLIKPFPVESDGSDVEVESDGFLTNSEWEKLRKIISEKPPTEQTITILGTMRLLAPERYAAEVASGAINLEALRSSAQKFIEKNNKGFNGEGLLWYLPDFILVFGDEVWNMGVDRDKNWGRFEGAVNFRKRDDNIENLAYNLVRLTFINRERGLNEYRKEIHRVLSTFESEAQGKGLSLERKYLAFMLQPEKYSGFSMTDEDKERMIAELRKNINEWGPDKHWGSVDGIKRQLQQALWVKILLNNPMFENGIPRFLPASNNLEL